MNPAVFAVSLLLFGILPSGQQTQQCTGLPCNADLVGFTPPGWSVVYSLRSG